MSVMNCFLTADAAHVFTDGAIYTPPDMTVVGFASKVLPLPQYPAVVSAVGALWVTPILGAALAESFARGFDELLDAFPQVIETYLGKLPNREAFGPFTAGLAGWSVKDDRPAFGYVRSYGDEVPAFEITRATRFLCPAQSHTYDREILSLPFDPSRPGESGLEIMRAQRIKRFTSLNGGDQYRTHHAVGGFCQHTSVTRDTISMTVLERWPDEIGRPLAPDLPKALDTF